MTSNAAMTKLVIETITNESGQFGSATVDKIMNSKPSSREAASMLCAIRSSPMFEWCCSHVHLLASGSTSRLVVGWLEVGVNVYCPELVKFVFAATPSLSFTSDANVMPAVMDFVKRMVEEGDNTEILKLFLSRPEVVMSVNDCDFQDRTLLHKACVWGHASSVQLLLGVPGVDPNILSYHSQTALYEWLKERHPWTPDAQTIFESLLPLVTNINQRDWVGHTLLRFAVTYGSRRVLRLLLAAGACVETSNMNGHTPLHYAAGLGRSSPQPDPSVAGMLLCAGAQPNALTEKGETPLVFAFRKYVYVCYPTSRTCSVDREHAENVKSVVRRLLVGGACRHLAFNGLTGDFVNRRRSLLLGSATGDQRLALFRSLMLCRDDFWRRALHREHCCEMRLVVFTLLLVRVRLRVSESPAVLKNLPEEMWFLVLGFLRGADFNCI